MHELPKTEQSARRKTRPLARSQWTGTGWVLTDGHWTTEEHDSPGDARAEWMRWDGKRS